MSDDRKAQRGRPSIKADWAAIQEWCEAGNTYQGASFQFGVNVSTIRNGDVPGIVKTVAAG